MCTLFYRLVFFIFLFLGVASFSGANSPGVNEYRDELNKQLSSLNTELNMEVEYLEWSQKKLLDAEESLQDTSDELDRARTIANDSGDKNDFRSVRIISVRHERHLEKVRRRERRVERKLEKILNIEKRIGLIEKDLDGLNKAAIKSKSVKGRSDNKPKKVAKKESIKPVVAVKKKVKTNDVRPVPLDWPYLSKGNYRDKIYAAKRLSELEEKKRSGQLLEAPLNEVLISARSSFGKAEMEYIGDNLFSVVQPVAAGRHAFEVFNILEWHDIPAVDHNKPYRFIFDISSISQPRLILFREDLIQAELENTEMRQVNSR